MLYTLWRCDLHTNTLSKLLTPFSKHGNRLGVAVWLESREVGVQTLDHWMPRVPFLFHLTPPPGTTAGEKLCLLLLTHFQALCPWYKCPRSPSKSAPLSHRHCFKGWRQC